MKKHAIIPIFITHRGCPNKCVFCNQKAITTRQGDVTVDDAKKTIDQWLTTLNPNETEIEVSFFGGSFTGIPIEEQTAFLKLAKEYKDAGKIHKIHCSTRPDYINREILDNLKAYDMDVIELGVQSFDERVLMSSKRGHSSKDVYEAAAFIKEYGFILGIQLMIALPGDSYESCIYSANETVKLKPEIARLYPTVVLPETELWDMKESGTYVSWGEGELLKTVKDMYKILTDNGINVIRIGLKSNENVKVDTYHDAFGQLVKSSIALDQITAKLDSLNIQANSNVIIYTAKDKLNFAVGHKAENKNKLKELYPNLRFKFLVDNSINNIEVKVYV